MAVQVIQQDGTLKTAGDGVPSAGVVCAVNAATTPATTTNWRKCLLDSKIFDPYGYFDTTNNRFLPKIAGYYRVSGTVYFSGNPGEAAVTLYKNGIQRSGELFDVFSAPTTLSVLGGGDLIYLNGSTDYVELWAYTSSSCAIGATSTHMEINLVGASVGIIPEPWHVVGATGEPAFQNSWVNFGGTYPVAAYRKDPNGMVEIKGTVKSGTISNAIFTLPAGYRPLEERYYPVSTGSNATGANQVFGAVDIVNDGRVYPLLGNTAFFNINLTFRAEQ